MKLITIHQTSHWKTATATRPTEKQMISPASWFYYGKEEFEDICLEFLTLTHPEFKAYLNLVRCGFCPGQGRMEPLLIILRYVRVSWSGPNSSCRGLGEGRSWVYINLLLSSFSSTLKGNSWVVQLSDQDASWVPLAYDEDPEHAGEITFPALNQNPRINKKVFYFVTHVFVGMWNHFEDKSETGVALERSDSWMLLEMWILKTWRWSRRLSLQRKDSPLRHHFFIYGT